MVSLYRKPSGMGIPLRCPIAVRFDSARFLLSDSTLPFGGVRLVRGAEQSLQHLVTALRRFSLSEFLRVDHMPPSDPWNDTTQEFYHWVGRCITVWASIDEELFEIFAECMGPRVQSAIVYYRTVTLGARLGLTGAIVQSCFPRMRKNGGHDAKSLIVWREIRDVVDGLLVTRNRLAHQQTYISLTEPDEGDPGAPSYAIYEIQMSEAEMMKAGEAPKPLSVTDLKAHYREVASARQDLSDFFLTELPKRPQLPVLKRDSSLDRMFHEMRERERRHPPKSSPASPRSRPKK